MKKMIPFFLMLSTSTACSDMGGGSFGPAGVIDLVVTAGGAGTDATSHVLARQGGGFLMAGFFEQTSTWGDGVNTAEVVSKGFADAFLASYDDHGSLEWIRTARGTQFDLAYKAAISDDGSVFMVGTIGDQAEFDSADGTVTTLESHGTEDGFVAKYDSAGNLIWTVAYGGSAKDEMRDVCVLSNGNIAVVGYTTNGAILDEPGGGSVSLESTGGLDVLVAVIEPAGQVVTTFLEGGQDNDYGMAIAAIGNGEFVVGGMFERKAMFDGTGANATELVDYGVNGMFLARYDDQGVLKWAHSGGGVGGEAAMSAGHLAIGGIEEIYIGSFYYDNAIFFSGTENTIDVNCLGPFNFMPDGYLARVAGDGTPVWVRSLGDYSTDMAAGVAALNGNRPIVGGFFTQRVMFGDPDVWLSTLNSGLDAFIGEFDQDGIPVWGRVFEGQGQDAVESISPTVDNSILVGGRLSEDIRFSAGGEEEISRTSRGLSDAFVLRIDLRQ